MTSAAQPAAEEEYVVLLDESGAAIGTAPKRTVHHRGTPLHLAFSCYVFDGSDRLLLTQRAAGKLTWPGVWTNTLCGHPAPGEPMASAVTRRARDELGLGIRDLQVALPGFRYRAVMPDGTTEHEVCPVFTAVTDEQPSPRSTEVDAVSWVRWSSFSADVLGGRREVSPWCVEQVQQLAALAAHPRQVAGAVGNLPPAAAIR